MFALIDCHNFFVSCERVFRPDLENKPVMVLSSNDGCVIARSNEVKSLGIPMGIPVFKVRHLINEHNIQLFSSNFSLYGNLSTRVMSVLKTFVPNMEIYSVDEAFLDCRGLNEDLESFSGCIQTTVKQWTGIPVGVGIAPTKTLAKVATYFVKKRKLDTCILKTPGDIESALSQTPIEEVWGVGRKSAQKLKTLGIYTALDLKRVDPRWMRKTSSVVGERLVRELQGVSCLPLEAEGEDKKSLQVTRSFGRPITQFSELKEAVLTYACKLGEKLRKN
ncbi:MAG: Y-family DNA polymerase, partial [Alphaproteobacteria bacterium]|nr:Y-family DNA polymerase [Alphaproteobacteria bacterium]